MLMLCRPEGPARLLGSAIGWLESTPMFTTCIIPPLFVLITVDRARTPEPRAGSLVSSCGFVLVCGYELC